MFKFGQHRTRIRLIGLKSLALESQCAGILGHRAYHLFRCASWNFCMDLQGHGHTRTYESLKVSDDLFRNLARISAYARGIKCDGAVIALGTSRLPGFGRLP